MTAPKLQMKSSVALEFPQRALVEGELGNWNGFEIPTGLRRRTRPPPDLQRLSDLSAGGTPPSSPDLFETRATNSSTLDRKSLRRGEVFAL